jgi:putative hydrolase of the HAD superfamily
MIKAVLFDLDDTLFPQSAWLGGAWHAVAARAATDHDVDATRLEAALVAVAAEGSDRGQIIDRALADVGAATIPAAPLVDEFRRYAPRSLAPYPGVREALTRLVGRVRLGIVTDGDPSIQRAKLKALDLTGTFSAVVMSDELGREHRKPDPWPFRAALEVLAVSPEHAVFVGDRPAKDIVGATSAGLRALRVHTGEWAAEPDAANTWATASTAAEAIDLVLTRLDEPAQADSTPTSSRKSTSPGTSR